MSLTRISLSALALFLVQAPSQLVAVSTAQPTSNSSVLQVCTNQQTGVALTGDIELMLVMDNSKSLKNSDPSGRRFLQVRQMLRSVYDRISTSRNPRDVRFSLVTFANSARTVIPLASAEVLRDSNLQALGDRVERAAPGDQGYTDYVAALGTAIGEMESADDKHCRVIVWFTDGAYWPREGAEGATTQGGILREKVCEDGGFSDRLRRNNINLFPLYFEPDKYDEAEDPQASKDVMAHLTGDQNAFDKDPYRAGRPCDSMPAQIGQVLAASDVDELGQFFADLPNIIEGGEPVACPTKDGQIASVPLPAGRYIAQISIVKYSTSGVELRPENLLARQPDGSEGSLSQYFSGKDGRYLATPAAVGLLSGWTIEGSGEEHCIRAFPQTGLTVQILKQGDSTTLVPIGDSKQLLQGEDLVSSESDVDLPVIRLLDNANCETRSGYSTDLDGLNRAYALLTSKGSGVICVTPENSEVFAGGIKLIVVREGIPLVRCRELKISRSGANDYVNEDRMETSTVCEIDFADSGAKFLEAPSRLDSILNSNEATSCNIDLAGSSIKRDTEGQSEFLSVRLMLQKNVETTCDLFKQLEFSFLDADGVKQTEKILLTIHLGLQPAPNRLVARIATVALVAGLLAFALFILRRMTIAAAALIPAKKMCAVRFGAQAIRGVDGRVSLSVDGRQLRDVRIDMERVDRASVEGTESKLAFRDLSDELVITREMPPLRVMLREPWAWIDDSRRYVVHPKGRRSPANKNLVAPFPEAIVALDDGLVKGSENERAISVWVIKQKGSSEGDQIAVEEFLKENGLPVVDELLQELGVDDEPQPNQLGSNEASPPPEAKPPADSSGGGLPLPPDW
jgi:hypothetical protein